MSKVILFVVIILMLNVFIFFTLPFRDLFILDQHLVMEQPWRLITFSFYHFNEIHLIENIIGFLLVGFIAMELNIGLKSFVIIYLASIILIIPLAFIVFPNDPVAGNSTGIYGLLSLCLIQGRKLIPLKISIPLFVPSIFIGTITNFYVCNSCIAKYSMSEFYHFAGFLTGVGLSFWPVKQKKYLLRGGEE